MTVDRRPVERPGEDGNVLADAWIDEEGETLCVYLQDFLERPDGARGPATVEVELAVSVPVSAAASALGCPGHAVLDMVVERWTGRGGALVSWARELPGAKPWSHTDPI